MTTRERWTGRFYRWTATVAFWLVIAYFGLIIIGVWLYVVNGRTTREQTARVAEKVAAVQRCLESRKPLRAFSEHVAGVNENADVDVANLRRTLRNTPRSSPMYAVRKTNLEAKINARAKIRAVKSVPVPTVVQCKMRGE